MEPVTYHHARHRVGEGVGCDGIPSCLGGGRSQRLYRANNETHYYEYCAVGTHVKKPAE